jgi:DNA primase
MLIDRLKQQETEAIEASKADPRALQRYRELQTRRLQLEKLQTEGIIAG